MKPDRVVIGAEDPRAEELMREVYSPFTRTGAPIMVMDCGSAELSKYAANAMLATRISFMNEIANVCELVGADIDQVRRAVGWIAESDPSFLLPGIGVRRQLFSKRRPGTHSVRRREGVRLQNPSGGGVGKRVSEDSVSSKMRAHFGISREDRCGLGPVVQAQDRRHA